MRYYIIAIQSGRGLQFVMKENYGMTGRFFLTNFREEALRYNYWYNARMAIQEELLKHPREYIHYKIEMFHVEPSRNDVAKEVQDLSHSRETAYWKSQARMLSDTNSHLDKALVEKSELVEKLREELKYFENESQLMTERVIDLIKEKEELRINSYAVSKKVNGRLADCASERDSLKAKLAEAIAALRGFCFLDRPVVAPEGDRVTERARRNAIDVLSRIDGENGVDIKV